MTYSPLLPASQPGAETCADRVSAQRLRRLCCLLHCPLDTPQLWKTLLTELVESLGCSAAQIILPTETEVAANLQTWQVLSVGSEPVGSVLAARLWQVLDLTVPSKIALSQQSLIDLKMQMAALVSAEGFRLVGAMTAEMLCTALNEVMDAALDEVTDDEVSFSQCFGGGNWVLQPLMADRADDDKPACLGLLALQRSPAQGQWQPADWRWLAEVSCSLYLALLRSQIDCSICDRNTCDELTHLPDRATFNQQLEIYLTRTIEQDHMLGVAFLDLDRFKTINDTLGHEAGDCLLQQVAQRLQGCLRDYDVVARWGGDEFTLLLPGLRSPEDISHIAERILQRLAAPFQVQTQDRCEELYVTASLGIALAPYDGEDGQTLLRNADAAMYQAKGRGRNTYQVYFEEINADARNQLNLETDLRKALANDEFFLCYQPQVNLRTGQWIGLEALIRWQHPSLGLVSPGRFIAIAEETGLIEPIGRWVLQTACRQYRCWKQAGLPPIRLAVNLSAQQFHRSNLVRSVMQVLQSTQFDPQCLELEVTESAAMQDVNLAIDVLNKLSQAGVQIAMDDFGTGYSSLSVLKHFPLDTIKIDRSFVKDLVDSPSDAAIASTIIALAKGLNFSVLAEGIETAEQASALIEMGCDSAQGYWFSRPLNVGQIDKLLAERAFSNQRENQRECSG